MQVVYAGEEAPKTITKSLFLAGPSPRPSQLQEIESWRDTAIQILQDIGFEGTVFTPIPRELKEGHVYEDQVNWEEKFLNIADCILFWVPRDLSQDSKGNLKLPALTTNVEFGFWAESGRIVFGCPENAEKVTYLKHYCEKFKVPIHQTLTDTLRAAIEFLGEGSERSNGEIHVPLFIWKQDSFQSWYKSQTIAGNRLDDARVLYTFRPGYKDFLFLWILKVSVYVAAEKRNKTNEFVLSRPDISSILLYHKAKNWQDTKVIIVKEFRSPANTEDGFVRELVGGSSFKPGTDPKEIAAEEVHEETGFELLPSRLVEQGARQLAATLSSHKSHLYSVEITDEELQWFVNQNGIQKGNIEDTEITYIEIYTIKELLDNRNIDWSNLGMVFSLLKD
jgi:8-oxo-dGTP pyrophosphatase MutT (NUDIX family)